MVAAVDLLACLLLVFCILALLERSKTPPAVETLGAYAVEIRWADMSLDDIDVYLADPQGNVCFFQAPDVGLMHLEYDNLGFAVTGGVGAQGERIIVRGVQAGEYVANVHVYNKSEEKPAVVTVTLWRLSGADTKLKETIIVLKAGGDEETAFRFVVQEDGTVDGYSTLQRSLVGDTVL